MTPLRIVTLEEQLLLGHHTDLTLNDGGAIRALWQGFRRQLATLPLPAETSFYNLTVYSAPWGSQPITPTTAVTRWAAVLATPQLLAATDGLSFETLPISGTYAVFRHEGPAAHFPATLQRIFVEWLPTTNYAIDDRPHFEVLPPDYNPTDLAAQEEVWIPIR